MIENWIPALTSTTLLAAALFMSKSWLMTRLAKSVQYDYDKKIEALKSDLKIKETEINALRNGALTGLVDRQKVLYEKKVQAVELVWTNVITLAPAKLASNALTAVNYEYALKEAENDPKIREFFKSIGPDSAHEYIKDTAALSARPFLSELAWALFSAYSSILSTAVIRLEILKIGVNQDFTKEGSVLKVVKLALPNYKNYIDEHGVDGLHHLLEILETSILTELKATLEDIDSDQSNVERAAKILAASEELLN